MLQVEGYRKVVVGCRQVEDCNLVVGFELEEAVD